MDYLEFDPLSHMHLLCDLLCSKCYIKIRTGRTRVSIDLDNHSWSFTEDQKTCAIMDTESTVLVVGATGKQGRSTVKFLLEPGQPGSSGVKFKVQALTRDTSSASAHQLLERNKQHADDISLVQGDLDKPDSIRKVFQDAASSNGQGIWGVFVALAYPGLGESADGEIKQAKVRLLLHFSEFLRQTC